MIFIPHYSLSKFPDNAVMVYTFPKVPKKPVKILNAEKIPLLDHCSELLPIKHPCDETHPQ